MGCHTYINYPAKKQDKIKQVFLDRMKDDISEIQKHYTNKKYWIKLKKELKMLSDKDVWEWKKLKKSYILYYKQIKKCLDKGTIHPDYMFLFDITVDGVTQNYMWYDNTIYIHKCNDFFRIQWYDAPYCHSLEETIKMLNYYNTKISPNEPCVLTEEQRIELEHFWYNHSDGIISFH